MKNLIKQFTFKTPAYTLGQTVDTVGNIKASYFHFNDTDKNSSTIYVAFLHNDHPLFYVHWDSVMRYFTEMTDEDVASKYNVRTIVDIIVPLFESNDEAMRVLSQYQIKETFKTFKQSYQDILEIYNQLEDQTMLNVGFPFDLSFDEIAIAEWCDNVETMHEFAVEIIKMFDLTT